MRNRFIVLPLRLGLLTALPIAVLSVWFLATGVTSRAVQNPSASLDMVPSGNSYDDTTNVMSVGSIENCLTSQTANTTTHTHQAHLVVRNIEDLIGWQVRLNYIGDRMRPLTQNVSPFTDNTTAQSVGFTNIPIDPITQVHRDITSAASIPPAPADGTNTPQTALMGAAYVGTQTLQISPDTPAKSSPDDTSYTAATGGVLASLVLQVVGNEAGEQSLSIDLDDDNPNPPGSAVVVFTEAGSVTNYLAEAALGDGFHGEGVTCVASQQPSLTPSPTAPATATPPPTSGPTPTAAPGAQRAVVLDSQPGDYIGAGQTLVFKDLCDLCLNANGYPPSAVEFGLDSQGHWFTLEFEALQGSPLVPGTYEGAARFPFNSPDQPGLSIFGDGRGCNELTGRFVVQEATYDSGGRPLTFAVSFEQHCEGGPYALFGDLRFNSNVPLHPLASAPSSLFYGTIPIGASQSAGLQIINIGSDPLMLGTGGIGGQNPTDFQIQSNSCENSVISVGSSCTIPVRFSPTATGPRSATLTIPDNTLRGQRQLSLQGSGVSPTPTATATSTPTPRPTSTASPTTTPTPTPIPTTPASGIHTAGISRIGGPSSVRLRPGIPDSGRVTIVAANGGDHSDMIGVYVAFLPPGGTQNFGGCSPSEVSNLGALNLLPGGKLTVKADPAWQCADPAAMDGVSWTIKAIADVHADDFASCSTLVQVFSGQCSAALADDDNVDPDNTLLRARPHVVALSP